uniref:Uncharacterized protein n=1 Tax=Strongyloides papillosus TaxID=174720 RepID=A0A0N5CIZ9_STREA
MLTEYLHLVYSFESPLGSVGYINSYGLFYILEYVLPGASTLFPLKLLRYC